MIARSKFGESSPQFESLTGRLRAFLVRCNELASLGRNEIDDIARELNLSTSDFHALAREPGFPELLRRRLVHAGLAEDALAVSHGDVLRDLQRVCGLCQVKARCAADLKREKRASPMKYCPNEQTLRALSREADCARAGPAIDVAQSTHAGNVVSITIAHPEKAST
ncbi:hypothetical protein ACFFWD_04120 [Bradyrhizobium erythrophlei]|uniref:hypothetical protein n=1 Tax=Bradyrhizobium erythrophlei TaxID=1437360 RepID=UPI0035E6DD6D